MISLTNMVDYSCEGLGQSCVALWTASSRWRLRKYLLVGKLLQFVMFRALQTPLQGSAPPTIGRLSRPRLTNSHGSPPLSLWELAQFSSTTVTHVFTYLGRDFSKLGCPMGLGGLPRVCPNPRHSRAGSDRWRIRACLKGKIRRNTPKDAPYTPWPG
jgi:hypothetical protein